MPLRHCALTLQLLLLHLLLLGPAALVAAAADCVSIIGFSGCSWSSCGVVHNCVGGDLLTITGSSFDRLQSDDWQVLISNQYECSNASLTADGRVVCTLPHLTVLDAHSPPVSIFNTSTDTSALCDAPALGVLYAFDDARASATGVTGAAASCSWSSGAPDFIPLVQSVTGCNPSDAAATSSCDGSGQVTLTIRGLNFYPAPPSIIVQGASAAYSCIPVMSLEQIIHCTGLRINASDLNTSLALYVSNGLGVWSDQPIMLTFSSSGSGGGGGAADGELSSSWLILLSCVLGVVIIGGLILCALSCFCGVSLSLSALMRCCRKQQESSQPLLASQGLITEAVV